MKKIMLTLFCHLFLNVFLYSQTNILTLTHTFDFISGSTGSFTLLPTGELPGFALNSVPSLNSNFLVITSNYPNIHNVDGSIGTSAATATTIVAQKAVLVNSDGNLVDLDGSLNLDFKWVDAGDYYLTVYHRNHLAVLSSGIVSLTN